MAVTRIKNNQVTDASGANTQLGINANTKLQNYSITSGKLANNLVYGSDLTVTGNLTVQGNTTTIDTTITTIEDPVIVLASTQTSGAPAVDIGFLGYRGNQSNIAFVWNEANTEFSTVFTSTGETNTTVAISSYANFHTANANIAGNLTLGGNLNITGNVSSLNVTGNIAGGNLLTTGVVSATGNATAGNVNTAGLITATGNVTGGNLLTAGVVSATGAMTSAANVTGGNLLTGGIVSATGNIIANPSSFFIGNGSQLTGVAASSANFPVSNGTSNINAAVDSNITVSVSGTSNVAVFAPTGIFVTGVVSATGNVTGGNIVTGGNVDATSAFVNAGAVLASGRIEAGTTMSAGGNITGNTNIFAGGFISATGNIVSASNITGANITTTGLITATGNINGGNLVTGGLITATGNITGGNVLTAGLISATGAITSAANITGGNLLTGGLISSTGNLTAGNLLTAGQVSAAGLATGGNVQTAGYVSAAGNVIAAAVNTATLASSAGITITTTGANGNISLTPNGTGNIVLGGNTYINGVSLNPVQDNDVASKYYVDNLVSTAISYHEAVVVATNTTLATATGGTITYNQPNGAGNGIGATLTTTGSFNLIDTGNVQTVGTRILVKNEANAAHNGIYVWSNATVITRSTDADEYGAANPNALSINDYFFVTSGNVNAGSAWIVDAPSGTITFGTSNIQFAQFSQSQVYSANTSAGLSLIGQTFSAKVDDNTTAFDGGGNIIVKAGANLTTPNIGAATGSSLSATGNIQGGNILTGGFVTATGNLAGGNVNTGGLITASGNITGLNVFSGNQISAAGNISGYNLLSQISVSAAGNVIGGNITTTGVISATGTITSAANISGANITTAGNVTGGNILTAGLVSATGNGTFGNVNTAGSITATGNITGGNVNTAGSITATGNITGGNVDTAGSITATGNITGGNLLTSGLISSTGAVTSSGFTTTGNVTGGNILYGSGIVSGTGNIYANKIFANIAGNIDAAGNVNEVQYNGTGDILAASAGFTFDPSGNVLTANGNINGSNLLTGGTVSATGNVLGGNLILSGAAVDTSAGRLTVNSTLADADFAVNGLSANVFYVDAGTNTASFGSSTQVTNAIVNFATTNSIKVPVGNTAQRPGTGVTGMVRFNTTNNNLELYDNSAWTAVGVPVFTVIADEQFNGDGSTVAFTLTNGSQTTNSCIISINGVVQIPNLAYGVSGAGGNILTFTEAPAAGDVIDVREVTTTTTVTSISNSSGNAVIAPSVTAAQVNITGNLIPSVNNTYSLGNATNSWSNLYVSGNTIYLGTLQLKQQNATTFAVFQADGITAADIDVGNIDVSALSQGNSTIGIYGTGQAYVTVNANANVLLVSNTSVLVNGALSATGNITGNYFIGNGSQLTGIDATAIQNGTANVRTFLNGNVTTSAGGTANVLNITSTGAIITGDLSVTGNATLSGNILGDRIQNGNSLIDIQVAGGNANIQIAGTSNVVVIASTGMFITGVVSATSNVIGGNITTAGLMTATGNITGGNILTAGVISATGNITGNYILGNGSQLTGIDATSIQFGTSNVKVVSSGGNVTTSVGGSSNIVVVATTGQFITGVNSATGNITGGNILTAGLISATSSITSAANIVGGNITTAGLITATGNVTGGNVNTAGLITATGNVIGGNFRTTGLVTVTGSVIGGNIYTAGIVSATGAVFAGADLSLTGNIVDTGALVVSTSANGNITLNPNGTGVIIVNKDILNGQANATGNIGNSTGYFNTIFAKATSAQYADLAEKYTADADYAPGTVVMFGGSAEITLCINDACKRVAGVISTNPSYRMNDGLVSEHTAMVALTGRVPTRVTGSVRKGDLMVSAGNGAARAEADPRVGTVIGKALADSEGDAVIEIVVGRV